MKLYSDLWVDLWWPTRTLECCVVVSAFLEFLVIIAQNRKFSKNDKAAITANIASLGFNWDFSSLLPGLGAEMFHISD